MKLSLQYTGLYLPRAFCSFDDAFFSAHLSMPYTHCGACVIESVWNTLDETFSVL
jgi:hypothetical protein